MVNDRPASPYAYNKSVTNAEQALLIYQIYLKRSRIETVFKILKKD